MLCAPPLPPPTRPMPAFGHAPLHAAYPLLLPPPATTPRCRPPPPASQATVPLWMGALPSAPIHMPSTSCARHATLACTHPTPQPSKARRSVCSDFIPQLGGRVECNEHPFSKARGGHAGTLGCGLAGRGMLELSKAAAASICGSPRRRRRAPSIGYAGGGRRPGGLGAGAHQPRSHCRASNPLGPRDQKFGPAHTKDRTPSCCGCSRMERRGAGWAVLQDGGGGRRLCLECLGPSVLDPRTPSPSTARRAGRGGAGRRLERRRGGRRGAQPCGSAAAASRPSGVSAAHLSCPPPPPTSWVREFFKAQGMPHPYAPPLLLVKESVLPTNPPGPSPPSSASPRAPSTSTQPPTPSTAPARCRRARSSTARCRPSWCSTGCRASCAAPSSRTSSRTPGLGGACAGAALRRAAPAAPRPRVRARACRAGRSAAPRPPARARPDLPSPHPPSPPLRSACRASPALTPRVEEGLSQVRARRCARGNGPVCGVHIDPCSAPGQPSPSGPASLPLPLPSTPARGRPVAGQPGPRGP
jgi:hypothetical protein